MAHPPVNDAHDRHVAASEAILAQDGDQAAHQQRLAALHQYFFGPGLDLGQVARGAQHGLPPAQIKPDTKQDQVADHVRAFMRKCRLV
jgi:hypothetical protein